MLREASSSQAQTLPIDPQVQASPTPTPAETTQALGEIPEEITEPTALFGPNDTLCLTLSESGECLRFRLGETPLIVGRADKVSEYHPNIDLSEYGAYRLGLSRKHAQVMRQGQNLWLIDLGGRNGTYLNEHRLQPHRPYVLREGDQLMLGNLSLSLSFQRAD